MSEKNKDLKTIDDALNSGALNENDVFEFDSATVEIIYGAAERMAAEIERLNESLNEENIRANVLERCVEEREAEIARLKAELEKKEKVLNELRPYLEPAGVEYNDLEEMFDEKHIDRDGPDMVLVPTSHWNKIQTAFYVGRTQTLGFKAELEKRPEIIRCGDCRNMIMSNIGYFCEITGFYIKNTDWCCKGQRRESEDEK